MEDAEAGRRRRLRELEKALTEVGSEINIESLLVSTFLCTENHPRLNVRQAGHSSYDSPDSLAVTLLRFAPQDVLQAVVLDCEAPALRRVANIEAFLDRFQPRIRDLASWRTNYNDFDILKTIGKGAFGMVQLVRHIPSRKVYAMKLLNKHEMVKRSEPNCFWEERFILANANSDWIVKLYYAFQDSK